MTAIPSIAFHDMDSIQPDDNMDLASSPYRQADDLDLDLDHMREPSAEPNLDSMFDETFDNQDTHSDTMEAEPTELSHDDDMIDEETTVIHHVLDERSDFNMEPFTGNQEHLGEDEDILYEEEEQDETENTEKRIGGVQDEDIGEMFTRNLQESAEHPVDVDLHALPDQQQTEGTYPQDDNATDQQAEELVESHIQEGNRVGSHEESRISIQPAAPRPSADAALLNKPTLTEVESHAIANDASDPAPYEETVDNSDKFHNVEVVSEKANTAADSQPVQPTDDQNAPPATNDPYLHPIKVIYQDSEICLFPPTQDDNSETFFLSDVTLAHENLNKLLAACRDVLVGTIGDDDELVLDVASLGLHICEDSKYATQISLSQILDVYLALSHNENVEQIEPLYCTLTSRVCLASQYTYLTMSAQQGKTFTEISVEHLGSPDDSAAAPEDGHPPATTGHAPQEEETTDGITAGEDNDLAKSRKLEHAIQETSIENEQSHSDAVKEEQFALVDGDADQYTAFNVEDLGDFQEPERSATSTIGNDGPSVEGEYDFGVDFGASSRANGYPIAVSMVADHSQEAQIGPASPGFSNSEDSRESGESNELEDSEWTGQPEEGAPLDDASVLGETNSSHTVQGDEQEFNDVSDLHDETERNDTGNQDQAKTESSIDHQDPADFDHEALFEEPNAGTDADDNDAIEVEHPEDDLLDLEIDHVQDFDNSVHVEEEQEDLFSETGTAENEDSPAKNSTSANGSNVSGSKIPLTPSKGNPAKRKIADEEDDFDLLDLGTPDTKRRRPS